LTAYQLEKGQVATPASGIPTGPWCAVAQHKIVGLSAADAGKLKVEPCTLVTDGLDAFEHDHTNYTVSPDGQLDVTCYTAVETPAGSIEGSQFAPKSVDCKMVDATRLAQQLHVSTNASVSCAEINRMAVEVAKKLVPKVPKSFREERARCLLHARLFSPWEHWPIVAGIQSKNQRNAGLLAGYVFEGCLHH